MIPTSGAMSFEDPKALGHLAGLPAAASAAPTLSNFADAGLDRCCLSCALRRQTIATMLGLDQQGWITIVAGLLLALITLFTSYSHVDIPGFGAIGLNQQVGLPFILASLAALVVDAQLATRRRIRDQRDRVRAQEDRARAANEASDERERAAAERGRATAETRRAARRARRQDCCTLAQLDFQLNPGPSTRQRLADMIALIREYGESA